MARLTIMKKILCGRVAINCDDYLERSSTRTRTAKSVRFKHYRTNTEVFKNSYFPRTVPLWNGTPDQFVNTLTEVSGCPVALGTSLDSRVRRAVPMVPRTTTRGHYFNEVYLVSYPEPELLSPCTTRLGCMCCIDTWQITTSSARNENFLYYPLMPYNNLRN